MFYVIVHSKTNEILGYANTIAFAREIVKANKLNDYCVKLAADWRRG